MNITPNNNHDNNLKESASQNLIIVGGAIGNCVHVAGVFEYLNIAEKLGYVTHFLGAAVEPATFAKHIAKIQPDIVCISYRLTASALKPILDDFFLEMKRFSSSKISYYFGGTPECIEIARQYNLFSYFFKGEEEPSYILASLQTQVNTVVSSSAVSFNSVAQKDKSPIDLIKILKDGHFLPMIRHHFGLPSLEESISGIKEIALSKVVDVISLAPDQNAQEHFFEQEKMNTALNGSGGIPIRSEEDLKRIWEASQHGNNPRLRIYAGTKNLLQWAEMSTRLINNAWAAIPLYWYSELDGRSKRPLKTALEENIQTIKWYAQRGIPVEINDAHQWSLRECADVTAVADFYLAAYNAKKAGVTKYVAQLMFNTPRLTSPKMDLAKMLAKLELIDDLVDENFVYLKQVRAGLTHFSVDKDIAKGQLASSTLLALALRPHIIHVVSFTEANHAATAKDVIESCKIVKGVLRNSWKDFPDLVHDKDVQKRKKHLVKKSKELIQLMKKSFQPFSPDPLSDISCLEKIVKHGFLDAPHLKGNPAALGITKTMPIDGGYEIIDANNQPVDIIDHVTRLLDRPKKEFGK